MFLTDQRNVKRNTVYKVRPHIKSSARQCLKLFFLYSNDGLYQSMSRARRRCHLSWRTSWTLIPSPRPEHTHWTSMSLFSIFCTSIICILKVYQNTAVSVFGGRSPVLWVIPIAPWHLDSKDA